MLNFSSKVRFYLYPQSTDMRKSFEGLSGIVRSEMQFEPGSGDVYLFINRRGDRLKCLVWDRDGYWIYYKQLEKGVFRLPDMRVDSLTISYDTLLLMLAGIDPKSRKKKLRYCKNA
jgi:transposase